MTVGVPALLPLVLVRLTRRLPRMVLLTEGCWGKAPGPRQTVTRIVTDLLVGPLARPVQILAVPTAQPWVFDHVAQMSPNDVWLPYNLRLLRLQVVVLDVPTVHTKSEKAKPSTAPRVITRKRFSVTANL